MFILYIFFFWQHNFTFYCNTFILQKLPACNQVSKILLHICLHMELIDFTYIGIWKCYFLYMFALVRKEKWTIKDLGWLKILKLLLMIYYLQLIGLSFLWQNAKQFLWFYKGPEKLCLKIWNYSQLKIWVSQLKI